MLDSVSTKTKMFVALFVVYIVWGSTYLAVKIGIEVLPPLLLTSIRFLLGGILLFLFTLILNKKFPTLEEFKGSAFLGVILTGIGTTTVAYSLLYIPSGLVALIVAMLPFWIFILDMLFFSKSKPSLLSQIGLILGMLGVVILFNPFGEITENSIPLLPTIIISIGSISWAYGSIKGATIPQPKGIQSTAIQMMSGGLFALIFSIFLEDNQIQAINNIDQKTTLAVLYLIIFGSYLAYTAFVWLMNNAPPLMTSTYAYVNPVVAMFLGWIIADEVLSSTSILASVIILLGVVFMTLGRRKLGKKPEKKLI
jgi:drug/metabolite transporter (DMT)-like permease